MNKLPKVSGLKRIFHVSKNIFIAFIILGFGFRYLSIFGSYFFLTLGCFGYASLLIIALIDRPYEEYNWTKVFPELIEDDKIDNKKKS